MTGAPAETTPIRRVCGERSPSERPTPASSAPLPTGTTTAAGASPSWSTISSPIAA